ncbi:MAG: hypothetical protein IKG69_10400 [Atopobiaceae bacterium]|nr:hypothetical protein [Atopobiaceae bacterium]
MAIEMVTASTRVTDVIKDPVLGDAARLLLPAEDWYWSGDTLGNLSYTWYMRLDPQTTVDVVNRLRADAAAGEQVFYDIYTDAEKRADPAKRDTGLWFFRGDPGAHVAIVNAGGGFAYVGAMQDSLPHCLALSHKSYNAFALIYRPGTRTACEDLARAIAFLYRRQDELGVTMDGYSLWGGSAGARVAAWLGSHGAEAFGERAYPRPAAVVMQYTGLSEVLGNEPPTYNCVGTSDVIASWRTMDRRIKAIKAQGTDAMIEVFEGLPHGFGLGVGTVAEGWLDNAAAFWERQLKRGNAGR